MQDNSQVVALLNRRDDIERKYKGGRMPISVIVELSNIRFAIQLEIHRMQTEQLAQRD